MLAYFGLTFKDAVIDMTSCPYSGLNGKMQITELRTDSMLLDTIRFAVESDSARCNYKCQIRNGKNNPQYVFNALLDGYIHEKAAGLNIKYYDAENRLGRLVIIIIRHKIFHCVLGEHLLEFSVELRSKCFIMSDDKCRLL